MKRPYNLHRLMPVLSLYAIGVTILLIVLSMTISDESSVRPISEDNFINAGCSDDLPVKPGPQWRNIKIGESNLLDIQEIYGVHFTQFHSDYINLTRRYYTQLTMDAAYQRGLAQFAEVCIVDRTIATLKLTVDSDNALPDVLLSSWVRKYGIPDLVTWEPSDNTRGYRLVVWPEEGIILTVDASPVIDDPALGLGTSVTLAPYASKETFLLEWPYYNLPDQPPVSRAIATKDFGVLEPQNPFDFERMLEAE